MPSRTHLSPTVLRRLEAGEMLLSGATLNEVVDKLRLSPTTVRKYRHLLDSGGLDALRQLSVGGKVAALNADAMSWIQRALAGSARDHGFESDAWTSGRLRELIARQFGVTYSRVHTWQIATNLGMGGRLSKSRK